MVVNNAVPVVVIYRGGIGALAIARTLGRLGVPMYLVLQEGANTPLAASRYWRKIFSWDFSAPAQDSVRFLHGVARSIGTRPVLLTLADWIAVFIEQHASELQGDFIFPRAAPPLIRTLSNKWNLYLLAKQHKIPTPETVLLVSRGEVLAYAQTATFPLVMKPADSFMPNLAAKAIVHNPSELLEKYDAAADAGCADVVLQDYVPGDARSVWMSNAYFGAGSECKAIFTGQKLRQVSETGIASLGICLPNETVERQTRDFMQAVAYEGVLDVGYRFDPRDGQYKVLDVNPRIGGAFRLFLATNGLDVVRVCYMDLTGQDIPVCVPSFGRKWMLEEDFTSALDDLRSRKLTFKTWLQSLRGVKEMHWFAPDDPMPILHWLRARLRGVMQRRIQKLLHVRLRAPARSRPPER